MGVTFWISATNSDQNFMKMFLVNILVIWMTDVIFLAIGHIPAEKGWGQKKK
jgi:hypothetical protein